MEVMDFNEERHKEMNTDGQEMHKNNDKKPQKNSPLRELFSWIFTFAVAFAAALLIKNYVIINANILSGSMENTIMPGDDVIGFRLAYKFSDPKRGDIVIFWPPTDSKDPYIKRIIGLPGEKVTIEPEEKEVDGATIQVGKVYIDGEALDEDYLKPEEWDASVGPYEFEVPDNCYLMMGDNRNGSSDARAWLEKGLDPYVSKDDIIGKAVFRYYPFNRVGTID